MPFRQAVLLQRHFKANKNVKLKPNKNEKS
jgi:hypothetical protein